MLDIERILLHGHKVSDVAKEYLYEAIVIGVAVELRADELRHELASFARVMRLGRSVVAGVK